MSESSFTLLRDIGTILLENGEEVRFSIDAYRGYRYVSVRRYIQTDGFTGATRDGVTLTPEIVQVLVPLVARLPDDPKAVQDGVLANLPNGRVFAWWQRWVLLRAAAGLICANGRRTSVGRKKAFGCRTRK